MDLEQLINEYKLWVAATPSAYKVTYGVPSVAKIAPVLNAIVGIADNAFTGGATLVTITKVPNLENLDGFLAWYTYVYLPSQP